MGYMYHRISNWILGYSVSIIVFFQEIKMDCHNIQFELPITSAKLACNKGNYSDTLLKSLYTFWQDGKYCDITLHVGDRSIKAHKNVLATLSEYFKILLEMDAKDKSEANLHDVDFPSLELLLQYAYTGQVEITRANVPSLLITADYLQVQFVKEACEKFILKGIHKDNCVAAYMYACTYSLDKIKDRCVILIGRHLEEISRSEVFLSIPFTCLFELLNDDRLLVFRDGYPLHSSLNELAVLKAALQFISGQRKPHKLSKADIYRLVVTAKLISVDYDEWQTMVESHKEVLTQNNFSTIMSALKEFSDTGGQSDQPYPVNTWYNRRRNYDNAKIIPHNTSITARNKHILSSLEPFDDKTDFQVDERTRIRKIQIMTMHVRGADKAVVSGLHVFDGHWRHHGFEAPGNPILHEVELKKNEVIVKVLIARDVMIHALSFETNEGRTLGPFGSESQCIVFTADPPTSVKGFLHSFSGIVGKTEDGCNIIAGIGLNWVCHRNVDDPLCIEGYDYKWNHLSMPEQSPDSPRYTYNPINYSPRYMDGVFDFGEDSQNEDRFVSYN